MIILKPEFLEYIYAGSIIACPRKIVLIWMPYLTMCVLLSTPCYYCCIIPESISCFYTYVEVIYYES